MLADVNLSIFHKSGDLKSPKHVQTVDKGPLFLAAAIMNLNRYDCL